MPSTAGWFRFPTVTDAEGTIIPMDNRAISFTVEGDAELIGDNPRKAEAGISTILLMAGKTSGIIKVKASSEGLAVGEIVVNGQTSNTIAD